MAKEIVITEQDAPALTPNERRILSCVFFAAHADSYVFEDAEDSHLRQWDNHWKSLTEEAKEIYYPSDAQRRFFAMEIYEAYDFGFSLTSQREDVQEAMLGMLNYVESQRHQYWEDLERSERLEWIEEFMPDVRHEC